MVRFYYCLYNIYCDVYDVSWHDVICFISLSISSCLMRTFCSHVYHSHYYFIIHQSQYYLRQTQQPKPELFAKNASTKPPANKPRPRHSHVKWPTRKNANVSSTMSKRKQKQNLEWCGIRKRGNINIFMILQKILGGIDGWMNGQERKGAFYNNSNNNNFIKILTTVLHDHS